MDDMLDHLGNDCEDPDAIYCDRCHKVLKEKQIAFAEDDRAWCVQCDYYLMITGLAKEIYRKIKE